MRFLGVWVWCVYWCIGSFVHFTTGLGMPVLKNEKAPLNNMVVPMTPIYKKYYVFKADLL
jgi:hypothetical protein